MWQVGSRVLATRLDDEFWYPGTVQQEQDSGWLILFDDGSELSVADDQLLPLQIDVGDRLFVRLPGGDTYSPCLVLRISDEKLNVLFEDGTDEQTSLGMIRVDPTAWKDPGGAAAPSRWIVGDRVLAQWSRDSYWYPGTIQVIERDRLHVYFDDGDNEWRPADLVCENDLDAGSRVFVRMHRGPAFFPAHIVRRQGERIQVEYDNGQKEDTSFAFVRVRRGRSRIPWKVGQRVLAQWLYEPYFYPGRVAAVGDDVVEIHYDDGDKGTVPPEAVLPLRLGAGDRVYARRQAARVYAPAVIECQDGDRLYLRYDDGQVEWSSVPCIRVLPGELQHLQG
jgi:hypothetical protein